MGALAIVLLIIYIIYNNQRVSVLEQELEKLQSPNSNTQNVSGGSVSQVSTGAPSPSAAPVPQSSLIPQGVQQGGAVAQTSMGPAGVANSHNGFDAFVEWLKEDFLVKLGAFLLLLAFGWFVSYAFINDWIGPVGRITFGLLSGVGVMMLGVWRITSKRHQGAIFVALGAGIVLLTIYAARVIYDFFTPETALGIMFLTVVFVAFVSVRYHSEHLALAGLILGALAPWLTDTPEPSTFWLLSYIMMLVLGTLWVVKITGSHVLTFAALVMVMMYALPFWFGGVKTEDEFIGLAFSFAFTAIFFTANVTSILHRIGSSARRAPIMIALGTGLYLMAWISSTAAEEWQTVLYVGWMMVFCMGAFTVYIRTSDRIPFYIYSAVGISLLAAATASELDGAHLVIAYSIEVFGLVIAAMVLLRDRLVARQLTILFIGPVLLSLDNMEGYGWRNDAWFEDATVLLIVGLTLWIAGRCFQLVREDTETISQSEQNIIATLLIAGGVYAAILMWLVSHAVLSDDVATMVSLIVYTITGLVLFIQGQIRALQVMRITGVVILALVVLRLLLVDVWAMELAGRIFTFFAIGVLLISTGFISRKKKENENIN